MRKTPFSGRAVYGGRRKRPYVPAVQRGPRRELKSVDFVDAGPRNMVTVANVVGASSLTTGMTLINGTTQGDGAYEHIGKNISVQSVAVEAELTQPQTDASSSTVRLMVVYDRQPNGAYPAIGDLLADNASAPTFNSAINIGYRERFAVLRDFQVTLSPAEKTTYHYETYLKRQLDTNYSGISNAIASVGSGSLLLLAFFVQLAGTTVPTVSAVHTRVRYYDS